MKILNTMIWNKITGEPWAITEPALQTILQIAERNNESPEAVAAKLGRELRNTHTVTERDGVAIIPVVGPLFRYANLFTQISGASSYEILAKDFTAALENSSIHAIVLDIDSPGGEVNGVAEFANMVFEARGAKPIIAYASGDAASGAYWIASAADQIVVSETSALGSIGVVGMYHGKDAEDAKEVEIVSSQSPYKRLDPTTDEGRSKLQSRIDAMAEIFITTISRNRKVDPTTVMDQFGGGDVLIGAASVAVGMSDRIGSLERIITELSNDNSPPMEGILMSKMEETPTMNKDKEQKQITTLEELKEAHPNFVNQIEQSAVSAERERIKGIVGCEAATGRESLAREIAFMTEISPIEAQQLLDQASVAQATPQTEGVTPFEKAMAALPVSHIAADDGGDMGDADAVAKRIAAAG